MGISLKISQMHLILKMWDRECNVLVALTIHVVHIKRFGPTNCLLVKSFIVLFHSASSESDNCRHSKTKRQNSEGNFEDSDVNQKENHNP